MLFARARKSSLNSFKIYGVLIVSLTALAQASEVNVAIVGGIDYSSPAPGYAAFVTSSDELNPLLISEGAPIDQGTINSVSMNSSGICLIGGQESNPSYSTPPYAAIVRPSGEMTVLSFDETPLMAMHGYIQSVAINSSGGGIIGGRDSTGPIYAALVPSSGNLLTPLTLTPVGGLIQSVAVNDSGNGLIGGQSYDMAQPAYAALVSSGATNDIAFSGGMATTGVINSVSINPSGNGLIGGRDLATGMHPAYVAFVYSGNTTPDLISLGGDMATNGNIVSVSINSSGNAIVGGEDSPGSSGPAYVALVSSSKMVRQLTLSDGMNTSGIINSVAINPDGTCLIGGQDFTMSQPAYAAFVFSSGEVRQLDLGTTMNTGTINSVAINSAGNGIIGGEINPTGGGAYAALVTSSGTVIPLTFTGGMSVDGAILSVALPLFNKIPTTSLSGNNLIFANYINEFAPENGFYFIPSVLDGTLNAAVQSAAPTRNGVSIYTASNNLFDLTTSFANHIRNQQSARFTQQINSTTAAENILPTEELLASLSLQKKEAINDDPNSIWFEAIGASAYQKSQHQTVGFNPTTGGVLLAFDRTILPELRLGGGVSYLFTHIHEKQGQGHSNINQEEAFIYSSWDNQQCYIDLLLMGGAVQIDQVRNTIMTSFSFRSTSHPNGWQLLPHLEIGFKKNLFKTCEVTFNPFVMFDWANAWQGRYKEKGDSPFNAAQKSYYGSLLRTEAGFRFYETFFFNSWNFTLQEKFSYVNTQSFNAGKVTAFLVGSPGSFTVETLSSAQNLGVAQLAMSFDPLNARYPTSTLFYQGEFGSQYQSHQLNIELAWQF